MTSGGVMIAPIAAPPWMSPCTKARSFAGYHSLTTRKAAMKFPDSPSPSRNRSAPSDHTPTASACDMLASDHHTMKTLSASRAPQRSTRKPEPTYISV